MSFPFSCNSGGKQQSCSIMLTDISVNFCQNTFRKWRSSMPSVHLLYTAHTYYSSPWHDLRHIINLRTLWPKSLHFATTSWKKNNVFTMNGTSFSRIIKTLLSLEKWDDAAVLASHCHLLLWRKVTVLVFFSLHVVPNYLVKVIFIWKLFLNFTNGPKRSLLVSTRLV